MLQIGGKPILRGISRRISPERRRKIQSFYFRNNVTIMMARFVPERSMRPLVQQTPNTLVASFFDATLNFEPIFVENEWISTFDSDIVIFDAMMS